MILPRPDDLKINSDAGERERKERLQRLNDAESAMVRRVNALTLDLEKEQITFEHQRGVYRALLEQEAVRLDNARKEILLLENRRQKALQPIDALKEQADIKLQAADARLEFMVVKEMELGLKENDCRLMQQRLIEREAAIKEQEKDADKRLTKIADNVLQLRKQADSLTQERAEFRMACDKEMEGVQSVMKEALGVQLANSEARISLEAQAKKVTDDKRALVDAYATLAKAKREILG